MRRSKSGLPRYCGWNTDRENGKRRVRFRKNGFSTYLIGTPWSEDFMRQYAAALDGVKVQTNNIGASRTVAGNVDALIVAYLDPASTSPFKIGAQETQRTRRNILENFRKEYGTLPLYRISGDKRVMLLTRAHMQRIVNSKASTPFAQRNFLNTVRGMFRWAMKEGRIPDDTTSQELDQLLAGLNAPDPKIAQLEGELAGVRSEAEQLRAEAHRAKEMEAFNNYAKSLQDQLPPWLPEDYARLKLEALAHDQTTALAFDYRNVDKAAVKAELMRAQLVLAAFQRANDPRIPQLTEYMNKLNIAVNSASILRQARLNILNEANKLSPPIDP